MNRALPRLISTCLLSACLSLVVLASGCGGRNLYRKTVIREPALKHTYVYQTREDTIEAGAEPVEFGSPLLTPDVIFVTSQTRGLEAMERATFRRKWQFYPKGGFESQPLIDNGTLYVGGNDGNLYAVDAEFGRVLWRYDVKAPIYARPTIAGSRLYFMASDDVVYCLDRASGKWVWHYKRGINNVTTVHGNSTPVLDNGVAYVGFSDGYLVALNGQDGNLLWEQKIHRGSKFTDVDAMPVIEGERLYIPSYDGELYALEKNKGKVLWRIDVGGSGPVLIDDKQLYLAATSGQVLALNKDTGRINWKFELDQGTPTSLVLNQSYLAFGSSQQYFYAIHKGDGTIAYRYNAGLRSGFYSAPAQAGQKLYAFSSFGNLHVFQWNTPGSVKK